MTLTAQEALHHIRHALSSDKLPSVGALRIINDAGQYLTTMHAWKWLEGTQADLSLTANQDYIWLPDNVREVTAIVARNSVDAGVTLTTTTEIARLRSHTVATAYHYWGALTFAQRATPRVYHRRLNTVPTNGQLMSIRDGGDTWNFRMTTNPSGVVDVDKLSYFSGSTLEAVTQSIVAAINNSPIAVHAEVVDDDEFKIIGNVVGAPDSDYFSFDTGSVSSAGIPAGEGITGGTVGGAPRPRLDLYPTPAGSRQNAFIAYYRAGWNEVRSDNDMILVPDYIEPLYIAILRAVALGYERDSEADVNQRLIGLRRGGLFRDARDRDLQMQPTYGQMQNGAAQMQWGLNSDMWNFDSTGGPV